MTAIAVKKKNRVRETRKDRIFNAVNILFWIIVLFIVLYPLWLILIASVSDPDAVLQAKVKLSNEDATEAADIYTELQKLVEESFANFVRNGVTDDSWNNFIAQAKAIGSERYIELYQNAYNTYLAK